MNDNRHPFKQAVALIQAQGKQGTGYLVAADRVATCAHVVDRVAGGGEVQLEFDGTAATGNVSQVDTTADVAILLLSHRIEAKPLQLAGRCKYRAAWEGYGFPGIANRAGIPIAGVIMDPSGFDDRKVPALVLHSPEVAAGMASPVGGFSGSPVVVDGFVVGHLKRIICDPSYPDRPAFGLLWATPAAAVATLLGDAAAVREVKTEPEGRPTDDLSDVSEEECHVFVSYHVTDRRWAMDLVQRLEGEGLKVFIDQKLKPDAAFGQEVLKAFSRSKSAVIVMSKSWLESRFCQEESNALHHRMEEDSEFLVVLVRIDDCALPAEWRASVCLDFPGQQSPEGEAYRRLLYAVTKKTAPNAASADRILRSEIAASDELFRELRAGAAASASRIYALWQQWCKAGMPTISASLFAAEALIQHGRPDQALEVLQHSGDGVRSKQLRALATAKRGRLSDAIETLELLRADGMLDAETGGILAGRYRQLWTESGNTAYLDAAFETYKQAYENTGNTYPGINAAALALQVGEGNLSKEIAREVLAKLPVEGSDHWQLATAAEAHLLLGDLGEARRWYRRAVGNKPMAVENIATMRRCARQDLQALKLDRGALDDVLTVPRIAAFAGHMTDAPDRREPRFPEALVGKSRLAIREKLRELRIGYGFSSAARGSDILFLEELLERGGYAQVILPFPQGAFAKTSVGCGWNERYSAVLSHKHVEVTVLTDKVPTDDKLPAAFNRCSRVVNKKAIEFAKMLDEKPVLLAVWNGKIGDGRGGTEEAVRAWREDGYKLVQINISKL